MIGFHEPGAGHLAHGSGRSCRPNDREFFPHLDAGDIAHPTGGNAYYIDDICRAKELGPNFHYVHVGTSGGV